MARSRSRTSSRPSRSSKGAGERQASSKSPRSKPAAEIEVVEEGGGMGIDDGIAIITTIVLLVAVLLVDYELGTNYGEGMVFK